MEEVWKPVVGYEGFYEASSLGNIKTLGNNKVKKKTILGTGLTTGGYHHVTLWRYGRSKSFLVHRLVAIAFITNPDGKSTVNHKNGIKSDCRAENLEWATQSENNKEAFRIGLKDSRGEKHSRAKLTESQVLEIRALAGTKPRIEIALDFNVTPYNISNIVARRSWKHI